MYSGICNQNVDYRLTDFSLEKIIKKTIIKVVNYFSAEQQSDESDFINNPNVVNYQSLDSSDNNNNKQNNKEPLSEDDLGFVTLEKVFCPKCETTELVVLGDYEYCEECDFVSGC